MCHLPRLPSHFYFINENKRCYLYPVKLGKLSNLNILKTIPFIKTKQIKVSFKSILFINVYLLFSWAIPNNLLSYIEVSLS